MFQHIEALLWYKKIVKIITITLQTHKLTDKQIASVQANLNKKDIISWYKSHKTYHTDKHGLEMNIRKVSSKSLLDGTISQINVGLQIQQIDKKNKEKIIETLFILIDNEIKKTNKEEGRIGVIPPDID